MTTAPHPHSGRRRTVALCALALFGVIAAVSLYLVMRARAVEREARRYTWTLIVRPPGRPEFSVPFDIRVRDSGTERKLLPALAELCKGEGGSFLARSEYSEPYKLPADLEKKAKEKDFTAPTLTAKFEMPEIFVRRSSKSPSGYEVGSIQSDGTWFERAGAPDAEGLMHAALVGYLVDCWTLFDANERASGKLVAH